MIQHRPVALLPDDVREQRLTLTRDDMMREARIARRHGATMLMRQCVSIARRINRDIRAIISLQTRNHP